METKIIEATQDSRGNSNWGKFMLLRPDAEWEYRTVMPPYPWPLLATVGWSRQHIWVMDLQTGEGGIFRPGGYAHADLEKHRIWVCPMYEPFLEWLYRQDLSDLQSLPALVELPDAEFRFAGHRRPGPQT